MRGNKNRKGIESLEGLLKHANIARWLCIYRLQPYVFYIAARLCHDHLAAPTTACLARETHRSTAEVKTWVERMEKMGLLTVDRSGRSNHRITPTLECWRFFYLILADMDMPVTDQTAFGKCEWGPRKKKVPGGQEYIAKAGARTRAQKLGALPKKRGRSIWERSGLPPIPRFQRVRGGAKSSAPALSAPTSEAPSAAGPTP